MSGLKYKSVKKGDDGKRHYCKEREERTLEQSKCQVRCEKRQG